jgi:hypothetical protein
VESADDTISLSGRLLQEGDLEAVRKLELIKRLLKHRRDPRVAPMLLNSLKTETDPEILKTIILGLGFLKDRALVPELLPFLRHSSLRVIAATIKSVCKLNPDLETETLHPLLVSRDQKVRSASILALLSTNAKVGMEMLDQIARSPSEGLRKTAVVCLTAVDAATCELLLLAMFERETEVKLLREQTKMLRKRLSKDGLEKLLDLKARLLAAKPDQSGAREQIDRKLRYIEKITAWAYENLDLSAGKIGTLEGAVDRKIAETEKREARDEEVRRREEHQELERRRAPAPLLVTMRPVLVAFATLAALGGVAHLAGLRLSGSPEPPIPKEMKAPELVSALGKVGERVSVDGEVLALYPYNNSVMLAAPGPILITATFPNGLPDAARLRAKVHLEGEISGVRSRATLYVAGTRLARSGA